MAAVYSAGLALTIAAPASAETLAEAIALAYDSNPTLQAQRATQRALDENWVQARTGYRPQASVTGSVAYADIRTPARATTSTPTATASATPWSPAVVTTTAPAPPCN